MDNSCENEDGNSLLNEKTTSGISFPRSNINYHNSDEPGNFYQNDLQPTCLDSGDVTVEEGYNDPDSAAVGGVSSSTRKPSTGQAHNIPYMQLFHHLKQKFPDLKDCDINESIQKFGLDRGRCEAELQQRAVAHTSGYYGPWGRTVGNWSTRSSPAPTPTRSDAPFTISHTTPSTPVSSPITSPFASQVPMASPPLHNSRSAPVLVGPPSLVGPPIEVNICPASLAETNCVVTTANSQYGLLISSSPCGLMTSSGMTGTRLQSVGPFSSSSGVTTTSLGHSHFVSIPSETIHTATTKHYVASHPVTPSLNDIVYRQHSTSTDTTITEEESLAGSNLTSPTSTLPLSPSPQPQGRSHSPTFSQQSREQQFHYPGQFCVPPLQQLPPSSRTALVSQYHQSQEPYVYQTSPHLYGWNPPLGSVPQNYPFVERPVNELNHSDYANSNHIEHFLVGPGRTPITPSSYSSGVPLGRPEFIPNISSSPSTYTTNSSRRSRSTTPGVVLSPPTSAPVISSSYEPFGSSYLYQHGEARRRRNEHVPLEPVRVAPPPPSAPSARVTNYFPGDSNLNDKLSNLHVNPALLGGTPTMPTMTTTSAVTSRSSPVVSGSRPSGGADRVASSAGAGLTSGCVPSTAAGAKHVASLHFVPIPPHSAHLIACPPPNKSSLELSDRSYTSVNLRLRQPSSDPQPAIDIKSSGSCLTYSTSSLDRRQGSRSSLQISIGPSGGSISAMRTNLSTELNRGNAALHIQYRAGDGSDDLLNGVGDEDACLTGGAKAAFPNSRDVHHYPPKPVYRSSAVGKTGSRYNRGVPYRVRPQSWYVSPTWQEQRTENTDMMSSVGSSNSNSLLHTGRRNSMPDSVRLAEAYAEEEQRRRQHQEAVVSREEGGCAIDSEVPWNAGEAFYVQGLVSEQRARQQRLRAVLQEGVSEFQSLKQEVDRLEDTLALRRQHGERAGLANAQRIEAMQEENRRLQSECDQMEGDILQTGEEPEVLDEEYCPPLSLPGVREAGVGSPAALSPFSPAYSGLPPTRTDPSGGGRSGHEAPRRLTPTRAAPPPPVGGATAHNLPGSVPYEQDEGRGPGGGGGGDEGGGARWSCNRCTYDNHPAMSSCEICGAIRMPGPSPLQQPPRSGGGGGGGNSSSATGHQQQQASLGRNTSYNAEAAGVALRDTVTMSRAISDFGSYGHVDGDCGAAVEDLEMLGIGGDSIEGKEVVKSVSGAYNIETKKSKDSLSHASSAVGVGRAFSSSTDDRGKDSMSERHVSTEICANSFGSYSRIDEFTDKLTDLNVAHSQSDVVDVEKNIIEWQHSQNPESFVDETFDAGVVPQMLAIDAAVKRKEVRSLKTYSETATVPRVPHDDLETFRFFSGLSLGSQSPRNSIVPSNSSACGSPASPHIDCYCHPRQQRLRVAPGHRRTGSGGTFSFLDRPHRDPAMAARRYSSDATVEDIRGRGGMIDGPTGRGEGSSGYSSSQSNPCEVTGGETIPRGPGLRSEEGGTGGGIGSISNVSRASGGDAFGSSSAICSGGSRSFGFDTSLLPGYPEDLGEGQEAAPGPETDDQPV